MNHADSTTIPQYNVVWKHHREQVGSICTRILCHHITTFHNIFQQNQTTTHSLQWLITKRIEKGEELLVTYDKNRCSHTHCPEETTTTLKAKPLQAKTLQAKPLKAKLLKAKTLKSKSLKAKTLKSKSLKAKTLKSKSLKSKSLKAKPLKAKPLKAKPLKAVWAPLATQLLKKGTAVRTKRIRFKGHTDKVYTAQLTKRLKPDDDVAHIRFDVDDSLFELPRRHIAAFQNT